MYKITTGGRVIRERDSAFIPEDTSNVDWAEYQSWLLSGNTPVSIASAVSNTVLSVSRFQAKAVLQRHGLLGEVEAYAIAPNTDPIVKLAWNEAVEVKRNSLMVMNIAILLDLSQSQLDNLFAEAATIEV